MDLKKETFSTILLIHNKQKIKEMSILDQYRKLLEEESKQENMEFPTNSDLTENDREAYEAALNKMRKADFSEEEVEEAINNSRKNMIALDEEHNGMANEFTMKIPQPEKITDEEMVEKGLLKSTSISDIRVIRAYCPKCGKELVAKAPAMFNPFTYEKICLHECCGTKFNLDKAYPHIAYYDENGEEIIAFGL